MMTARIFLTLFWLFLLVGCCRDCLDDGCPALSPGYCIPVCTCCCLEKDPKLITKIRGQGVQIERMGDKILLILPSDKFFHGKSPNLNSAAYPAICNVIALLNCFDKMEINVGAYTDNCGRIDENIALTKHQATNLVSYMWQHGLDARLVYPVGYGPYCPIVCKTSRKKSWNRRIEITLKHLPPRVSGEEMTDQLFLFNTC